MPRFVRGFVAAGFLLTAVLTQGGPLYSQAASSPSAETGQGAVVVSLGKDSPSTGKDAFVTVSLSIIEPVGVGKIVTDISYPNKGQIEFERAELTPDQKSAGVTIRADKKAEGGVDAGLKLTITSKAPIVDGIVANLVFKVLNRPQAGKFPGEEMKVILNHKAGVWTVDNREVATVTNEPGEVDFEYAPVVFACFFYMH